MPARRTQFSLRYLAVLAAAVFCYAALGAVVAILPRYVADRLGGGPAMVGLAVGAPALTGLMGRPLGGRLADRRGPLGPLLAGAVVMAVGALPAALSATQVALLLSRLAVGLGEGVMMGAAVLWLLRLAGAHRRGRALGHIGLANYGGLALGPLLATALGGVRASSTVLWLAAVLPLLGAAAALAVSRAPTAAGDAGAQDDEQPSTSAPSSTRALFRQTAPAGVGLLLVNVGYVSVLAFGGAVARSNATGIEALIVPLFAGVVIVARTIGGGIPDRLGGRRTVVMFAGAEALGLVIYGVAAPAPLALAALVIFSIGQALAVPGLGLLALAGVPTRQQGAAAGLFFAWFDAGVGLGGFSVGLVASVTGPSGALIAAGAAVATVVVISRFADRMNASARDLTKGQVASSRA